MLKVEKIDSVNISGKERKRFYFAWVRGAVVADSIDIWIEGIGSMHTLFNPFLLGIVNSQDDEFLCFTQNDTLKYVRPEFNTCDYTGVGIHGYNVNHTAVEIFPNPVINNITIEALQKSTMEILNIQGQTIIQQTVPQGKTDINISGLAKGVYIVRLCSNDKTEVARIVKE